MKRILLVNESFKIGGIETALVNLANALQKHCEVDILVYHPGGPMRAALNDGIRVLEPSWRMQAIGVSMSEALHAGDLRVLIAHLFCALWTKLFDNALPVQWMLTHEKRLMGYDLAIAFRQEQRKHIVCSGFSRYVSQCVDARVNAAWLHYDPSVLDLDSAYNLPFYRKMNKIVMVSKALQEKFNELHPELKEKTDYCYNVVDREDLLRKSGEPQEIPYPKGRIVCFSACRLSEEKALVRGIQALAPSFHAHNDLLWYIAGDGSEKENLQAAIREAGLEDRILLLGQQNNPYPYMKNADLLLNLSYHEAAPMVFLEAHALGVPVFATRTSSADELLQDGVTDFICENTEEGIRERFMGLMNNPQQLTHAKRKMATAVWPYESSVGKVLSWAEGEKH